MRLSNGTVIARGGLNLRRQPGTGRVLKALRRGSRVEVLGRETWLRVRTRDGREGWVLSDHVEIDPEDLLPSAPSREAVEAVEAAEAAEAAITAPATASPRLQKADPTGQPTEHSIEHSIEQSTEQSTEEPEPEPRSQDDRTTAPRPPSPVCDIRPYRNTRFIGRELYADHDFFACLDRLNAFAEQCDLALYVTSSTREPGRRVRGAVTSPATRSNHLVGHAIDVNVKAADGFYNSKSLRRANLSRLPPEVRAFIALVREDPQLRWGGDFNREDPVHIDDNLNNREPEIWDSKLASRA